MHWGSAKSWKGAFGKDHPFGALGPDGMLDHHPFGDMKIEFGKDFPFHQGPEAMRKKMQQLEERLNRLEGKPKTK